VSGGKPTKSQVVPAEKPRLTASGVFVQEAPERPPMKTANQIYALAPKQEDCYEPYDPNNFSRFIEIDTWSIPDDTNKRVSHRIVADPYIDGHRCHTLGTLWLDDKPFAVTQVGGRGGKDHHDYFVTDRGLYLEAWQYLISLYAPENPQFKTIDPDTPIRALTDFYSGEIKIPGE